VVAAAGLWYWATAIYAPANAAKVQSSGRPTGNNSDLYARWYGTRELLERGRDPYSPEMTREIQTGFYGRPLDAARGSDPRQQESFAYPLYAALLMAPLAQLPFALAQQVARWLFVLLIAMSVPLWAIGTGVRLQRAALAAAMILAAGSFPAVMEFYQQNLAALAIFLLAAAMAALAGGRLALAGFLLALATVKPEICGPLVLWLMLWAAAHARERWKLAGSFAVTLAGLAAAAEWRLPHWIPKFVHSLGEYAATETDPSLLRAFLPAWAAAMAGAGLLIAAAWLAWRMRERQAGSEEFGWVTALVGGTTLMVIPKIAAYNQALLIPALLLLSTRWNRVRAAGLTARAFGKAAAVCQFWQWGAAAGLTLESAVIPASAMRAAAALPLATLLAVPATATFATLAVTFKLNGRRARPS